MFVRLTALIACLVTLGGCHEGEDVHVGTFERRLKHGELGSLVELDDRSSVLTLRLTRGKQGQLLGRMLLDGHVEILGEEIHDNGNDPYPIANLRLKERTLRGKINIPDFFLSPHFRGEFGEKYDTLAIDVRHVGEITLFRVADHAPDEFEEFAEEEGLEADTAEIADTGLPLD